jgi:hypothetical protein
MLTAHFAADGARAVVFDTVGEHEVDDLPVSTFSERYRITGPLMRDAVYPVERKDATVETSDAVAYREILSLLSAVGHRLQTAQAHAVNLRCDDERDAVSHTLAALARLNREAYAAIEQL